MQNDTFKECRIYNQGSRYERTPCILIQLSYSRGAPHFPIVRVWPLYRHPVIWLFLQHKAKWMYLMAEGELQLLGCIQQVNFVFDIEICTMLHTFRWLCRVIYTRSWTQTQSRQNVSRSHNNRDSDCNCIKISRRLLLEFEEQDSSVVYHTLAERWTLCECQCWWCRHANRTGRYRLCLQRTVAGVSGGTDLFILMLHHCRENRADVVVRKEVRSR